MKFVLSLIMLLPQLSFAGNTFFDQQVYPGIETAVDSKSVYLLLGGIAGVATAHQQDDVVHDEWKGHKVWSEGTTQWGDDYGRYAIGFFLALGQTYFDRENGFNHLRALVANTIVTSTLKFSVQRERPNKSDHLSFPSGHSSDAFASATSLTYAYGWNAGVIAYPIATYIALSRVADEAHWLSDITAGAFIGIWMGRAFYYKDGKNKSEFMNGRNWQIIPEISHGYASVNLVTEF